MRILYVEDNEVNQALVERVLRAKKCSVVFREEGEGALEVLASDPAIDLILLDIELAGSMNGLDVIRAMRARNDHRPVVAITAYAMMGDRERFLEAGCDQYLPKPLVITDLLNLIDDYEQQFATKAADEQPAAKAVTTPDNHKSPATAAPATAESSAPAAAETPQKVATPAPASPQPSAPEETPPKATTPALMPAVKPASEAQPSKAPASPEPETAVVSERTSGNHASTKPSPNKDRTT